MAPRPADLLPYRSTRLPEGSYRGVLYTALALFGYFITSLTEDWVFLGLGLVLAALYLQGRVERERVWRNEGTIQRFFGSVERTKDMSTRKRP
ncbi:ABC transporter permease [Methanoculleus bourgensis]|uniref:Uncharacterized protein n=1 Tax=Methanoculleus bourgensis TaxID=83986 RepID=A0A0X3BK23_9EURY|nr:conserved protein of unknown function [Methanoculleus bourgensis]